jgi:hypothetical protein
VLDARSPDGMIFGQETGGGDGGLFKGILVRYLALLAREGNMPAATRLRFQEAVKHNANILNAIGLRRPEMIVGPNWAVRAGPTTDLSTQLSGLLLMEAAAIVELPMVYQHYNFDGRSSALPAGRHDTAALAARGVVDNDITSLTVPPGWRVTLFDGDDFSGASLVKSGNDTLLNDDGWNDRASSIAVEAPASSAVVSLYSDCGYDGYAVALPVGSYTLGRLQAMGMVDNDISAVRVGSGFQVTVFQQQDFTGNSAVISEDETCLVDRGFNDEVSSAVVSARGALFLRGDANASGTADMSDAITILGFLFLGSAMNDCSDAADVNDDGEVDISDPARLLSHLFLGSEAPPEPFDACGEDPTGDDLDCAAFGRCP